MVPPPPTAKLPTRYGGPRYGPRPYGPRSYDLPEPPEDPRAG